MLARLVAAHRALASSAGRFWASAAASTVLRAALVFAGVFCGMTYATSFEAVASSGCDAVSSWPANASGNYSQTGTFAAGEFLSVYIVNYNAPGGSGMPYSSSGSLSGLGSGQVPANTSSPTPNEVHLATTVGTGSGTLNVTVTGNAQITATCTAGVTVTATASATTQVGQTYDQISSISGGGFTDQFTVSVSAGALPTVTTLFSNNGGMTVRGRRPSPVPSATPSLLPTQQARKRFRRP